MCGDVWWLFPFVLQAIMERLAVKGAASDEKAHGFIDRPDDSWTCDMVILCFSRRCAMQIIV